MSKFKTLVFILLALTTGINAAYSQNDNVKLPPVGEDIDLKGYNDIDHGFWIAGQLQAGYSLFMHDTNRPYTEINVTGGYRVNEFLRFGVGFGGRYYIDSKLIRGDKLDWSFPIYANVRGNIIHTGYNTVVPYYSFDIGGAIRDGFFMRPTIGIRVGQERSAFLVGITYTGQQLKKVNQKYRFASFLGLTLGYEY